MRVTRNPCPPLQDYRNRDYVQHLLDDEVFDIMSADAHLGTTGCLDALECCPAGSMVRHTAQWMGQAMTYRELTLADLRYRQALTDELLKELK
jgi:hypothetical protein